MKRHTNDMSPIRRFWAYWFRWGLIVFAVTWAVTALIEHAVNHHGPGERRQHEAKPSGMVKDPQALKDHRSGARFIL